MIEGGREYRSESQVLREREAGRKGNLNEGEPLETRAPRKRNSHCGPLSRMVGYERTLLYLGKDGYWVVRCSETLNLYIAWLRMCICKGEPPFTITHIVSEYFPLALYTPVDVRPRLRKAGATSARDFEPQGASSRRI